MSYEDSVEHNEAQMQFMANQAEGSKQHAIEHLKNKEYSKASFFYKLASRQFADAAKYAHRLQEITKA